MTLAKDATVVNGEAIDRANRSYRDVLRNRQVAGPPPGRPLRFTPGVPSGQGSPDPSTVRFSLTDKALLRISGPGNRHRHERPRLTRPDDPIQRGRHGPAQLRCRFPEPLTAHRSIELLLRSPLGNVHEPEAPIMQ